MNFTGTLDSTPLTTAAMVREAERDVLGGDDSGQEALVDSLIERVSGQITDYLGRHTLRAAREETYYVRPGRAIFRLDGLPVDTRVELSIAHGQTLEIAKAHDPIPFGDSGFSIEPTAGVVRFPNAFVTDSYAIVKYTAGTALPGDPAANVPLWLQEAARLQVSYLLGRLNRLGQQTEAIAGGPVTITKEYGLLDTVREYLNSHRRAA